MINQIGQVTKFMPLKKYPIYWIPFLLLLFGGAILVIMIFGTLAYQILYLERGYPGVSVAGIDVAGMTQPQIVHAVSKQAQIDLNRSITIAAGGETWSFSGQQLGLQIDVVATADRAYQVGRSGHFVTDILTHLALIFSPRNVEPLVIYHSTSTNQVLQQLTDVINSPPQNAELVINSATDIQLLPAQVGRRLHIGATQPLIEAAIFSKEPQPLVQAFTQEVIPALTNEDIDPLYRQVQHLLSAPLIFSFNTPTEATEWRLDPDKLVPLITIVEKLDVNGSPQLTLEIDKNMLLPYIEEIAGTINQEPSDAHLQFDEENNQLLLLEPSQDGRTLDVEATYQELARVVAAGEQTIQLPFNLTPPTIPGDNPDKLGIKELVSESTSYFKGSNQGRMRNIALAASKFDGVVIPPGAIFSFNEHLGPVTAEEGYDESLIIYGDRTTVGIGGGVCQVSTTAFRTAFYGGFELLERWAHGYRVGWYETNAQPGLDATIYTPDVDLKFRNDSDYYLLVKTETDLENGTLTFKFYGTATGREVIVGEPVQSNLVKHGSAIYEETANLAAGIIKQVDWAKDGMDVTVSRIVKDGAIIVHEDEISSQYRPWRAVYQVGTGSGG